MGKFSWYTLVWRDSERTIPSTRAVWLMNCQLLSIHDECGTYVASASSGWGPVVLAGCTSWAEAEAEAVKAYRAELSAKIRQLQEEISFLDNNIEQSVQPKGKKPTKTKKRMEYGEVQESISLTIEYDVDEREQSLQAEDDGEKTVSFDWGLFSNGHCMSIGKILDFQERGNRLLQLAKDLLAEGVPIKVTVIRSSYEKVPLHESADPTATPNYSLNPLAFESWDFEGDSLEEDPDDEGAGLHLRPDPKYTDKNWKIILPWKQDILKSLAEANL